MSFGTAYLGENMVFYAQTTRFSSGAEYDAASPPTYRVYEMTTDTVMSGMTGSMTLHDDANTVGFYSAQIAVTTANGFEVDKYYCIRIAGTVDSVAAATVQSFVVRQAPDLDTSGRVKLQADGLDAVTLSEPGDRTTAVSTVPHMLYAIFKYLYNKVTRDGTTLSVYNDNDSTTMMTGTVTESGSVQTKGKFS